MRFQAPERPFFDPPWGTCRYSKSWFQVMGFSRINQAVLAVKEERLLFFLTAI